MIHAEPVPADLDFCSKGVARFFTGNFTEASTGIVSTAGIQMVGRCLEAMNTTFDKLLRGREIVRKAFYNLIDPYRNRPMDLNASELNGVSLND